MNQASVNVFIKIRHDLAANWASRNPVLLAGEFGLEDDTLLIKVGNGQTAWSQLPYLNKLNLNCFARLADGSLTFSSSFDNQIQQILDTLGAPLVITNDPVADTDPVNKRYIDAVVATIQGGDFVLSPATETQLGGVKSSLNPNQIFVGQDGFMTLNRVSTSLLYVPEGDDFIINGGTA